MDFVIFIVGVLFGAIASYLLTKPKKAEPKVQTKGGGGPGPIDPKEK
jgi:hypothetical protein